MIAGFSSPRGTTRPRRRYFYRRLGGAIEFGERAVHTLRRELNEEIGEEIADLHYLATLENIFTFNGRPGHEIVLVYGGRFVDPRIYARPIRHGAVCPQKIY
jgi:8-oxo-dGTP pyrophosphatase MutT (NUDIX family)